MSFLLPLVVGRRAFGGDPDLYDDARPGYPEAVYARLAAIGTLEGARLFEVGPGTGLATRRLLAFRPRILTAVEPDARLAAHLLDRAGAGFPQLEVRVAPFEEVALPAGSYDLGVSATAFHWLLQGPALEKAVHLLRPGGWWAMWWNVFGNPDQPDAFERATDDLFRDLPDSPAWRTDGTRPFPLDAAARLGDLGAAGLVEAEVQETRWSLAMTTRQVLALAATFSQVSQAEPEQRRRFLDALGARM